MAHPLTEVSTDTVPPRDRLHLWGDAIADGVATTWDAPRQRDTVDDFGAVYQIPLKDDTKPVNFIMHLPSGDTVPDSREPGLTDITATDGVMASKDIVIDATVRAMGEDYATVHRGVYTRSAEMTLGYEAARRRVASFVGGREDELVFTRGATELTMDAAGRVNLPNSLMGSVGIENNAELVLACQFDKVEVWSKKSYEALYDQDPADFAVLAAEVMGDKSRRDDGK